MDPRWSMGLPVTLFIARGRNLVDRAQLPELQSEALWNRYDFFANPLEEALRIIESQSEASALSRLARSAASYWGILVALSLALGMVKLSGDRRIEREKERKDKTKETKDGDEQKNAGDKDQEEGKLGEVMCASTAATADAPQPDSSCDPAVALPAEERGSAAASAPAEADPEIRR